MRCSDDTSQLNALCATKCYPDRTSDCSSHLSFDKLDVAAGFYFHWGVLDGKLMAIAGLVGVSLYSANTGLYVVIFACN